MIDWANEDAISLGSAEWENDIQRREWFKKMKGFLSHLLRVYKCDPGAWLYVLMDPHVFPDEKPAESVLCDLKGDLKYCSDRWNPSRVYRICKKFGHYVSLVDEEWLSNINWTYDNKRLRSVK